MKNPPREVRGGCVVEGSQKRRCAIEFGWGRVRARFGSAVKLCLCFLVFQEYSLKERLIWIVAGFI